MQGGKNYASHMQRTSGKKQRQQRFGSQSLPFHI